MKQVKTEAIILDTTDVFDADRSFLLFSKVYGKIRARAKGVRKPTSKLTGHLLAYLPTQLEILETASGFLIIQAQVAAAYRGAAVYPANSLLFVRQTGIISEALNRLYPEKEAHQEVYDGLVYTLDRLRDLSERPGAEQKASLVTAEFLLKALAVLGYRPELDHCVVTGQLLSEDLVAWNSQLGGALSEAGLRTAGVGGRVLESSRVLVVLRQLLKEEFWGERLQMSAEVAEEACQLVYDYLQTQIGQPLRSLHI